MLEKIGLPAKPSLRGSNWVLDASNCQGCSCQFTFLNRKHHCRRCGGLFCNSCTQQRMILRGQGDSPVRICDPCKKLEDAARFELRHGYRNRAGKGSGSKVEPKHEEELLNEILGTDGKRTFSSARESSTNVVSDIQRAISSASCSNLQEEADNNDGEGDILGTISIENGVGSSSPQELRQQAQEEKKKYRVLKGEGKSAEALQAFKHGKDLERQAEALEIALRKSRKQAMTLSSSENIQKTTSGTQESDRKSKLIPHKGKKEKDDLTAELKEMGWSDADLHEAENKPAKISLEGELSNIIGEISQKPASDRKAGSIDDTQVLVLKKKALALKREGKLSEAKEELKKAKILEKQIEEQELLAGTEDSDDEMSALIRSMDDGNDKHGDLSLDYAHDPVFNLDSLMGVSDDIAFDGNFDVTDDDMNDPEIAGALKSFGWTDDANHLDDDVLLPASKDSKALHQEVLSMQKEALNQKRTGNIADAMAQLKKARIPEKERKDLQSQGQSVALNSTLLSNSNEKSTAISADNETDMSLKDRDHGQPPKSKLVIQKELLALKRKALALRREGRLDEAEEELKKGKVLEHQLVEMENAPKVVPVRVDVSRKDLDSKQVWKQPDVPEFLPLGDGGEDGDVSENDMHDPSLLSMLKNLGWEDEGIESATGPRKASNQADRVSRNAEVPARAPRRSKAEIQRELLGLKRKALALRRQGKSDEAEEELTKAKALEAQLAETEASQKPMPPESNRKYPIVSEIMPLGDEGEEEDVSEKDMLDPSLLSMLKKLGWQDNDNESLTGSRKASKQTDRTLRNVEVPAQAPPQKALALGQQGKSEEAKEELMESLALEDQFVETKASQKPMPHESKHMERAGVVSLFGQEKGGNVEDGAGLLSSMKYMGLNIENGPRVDVWDADMKDPQLAKALEDMVWKEHGMAEPLPLRTTISVAENSQANQDEQLLITKAGPTAEPGWVNQAGVLPQPSETVNIMDLLTGDDWNASIFSVEKPSNVGELETNISLFKPDVKEVKDEISSGRVLNRMAEKEEKPTPSMEKTQAHEVSPGEGATSKDKSSLQQEIRARKRRAVALKREGKLAEAREELRQTKLLEKSLEEQDGHQSDTNHANAMASSGQGNFKMQQEFLTHKAPGSQSGKLGSHDLKDGISKNKAEAVDDGHGHQPIMGHANVTLSTSEDTSTAQVSQTKQATKPLSDRDRIKLQQECLAHKRRALQLRREGRMDESEAETELANVLESQLKEHELNASKSRGKAEAADDGIVEDFLDPQLLSALKSIGLQDADTFKQAPKRAESKLRTIENENNTSQERAQLEEVIKNERHHALELKQAGKKGEALDALRRAKQLQKKLDALTS